MFLATKDCTLHPFFIERISDSVSLPKRFFLKRIKMKLPDKKPKKSEKHYYPAFQTQSQNLTDQLLFYICKQIQMSDINKIL